MSDTIQTPIATQESATNMADSASQFADIYHASIHDREQFWAEQAKRIYWHKEPDINSKFVLAILILVNKLLVSAFILLEMKSTSPVKILFL